MKTPQIVRSLQSQEQVMTKTRKIHLVRVGDAKRLTKGQGTLGVEINLKPGRDAG
jgi:hypothetical protein